MIVHKNKLYYKTINHKNKLYYKTINHGYEGAEPRVPVLWRREKVRCILSL